jgi:glucose/arabinose dehydrogenase
MMHMNSKMCVFIACVFFCFAPVALAEPLVTRENVAAETGFKREVVVSGLNRPWGMAFLPGDTMLITERGGKVRLLKDGKLEKEPLKRVPEVFAQGQGGLLDVSIHPDFRNNRLVYFTYAHGTGRANRTRLARASFDGKRLKDWKVLFEVSQEKRGTQHFGSRILWLPDGSMLLSIGDGGNPPTKLEGEFIRRQAQNIDSHLGKVLRLNDDGTPHKDNPYINEGKGKAEIYSLGHRNIQGMAYDAERKMVWASEHGALGGDELNIVQMGKNYGWPAATHSREYFDGSKISPYRGLAGMVDPALVWLSAIAPSGLAVYTGDEFRNWRGDVFAGGLVSQDVRRIDLDKDGVIQGQTAIRIGQRVRDVRQGPDGYLYVLTDQRDGELIRLVPAAGGDASP